MTDNSKNTNENSDRRERLSDPELASLLSDDLTESERVQLIELLGGDFDAQEALALAASPVEISSESLPSKTIGKLMAKVRESKSDTGICPHCAQDIASSDEFCPHCGGQVKGNVLTCIRCGKPVREDGTYCPNCGNFFRADDKKSKKGVLDSPLVLLIPGLISLIIAIAYRPLYILFLALGCLLLGAWGADMWFRRESPAKPVQKSDQSSAEDDAKKSDRKSG